MWKDFTQRYMRVACGWWSAGLSAIAGVASNVVGCGQPRHPKLASEVALRGIPRANDRAFPPCRRTAPHFFPLLAPTMTKTYDRAYFDRWYRQQNIQD